ncbi:hypothetical protein Bpfe_011986 [Biomphalaria pfeifferi]|uniref:Uncharacterized protein n=1 Tax=Biomphalaria pfeifferi TaxID=112525 RepID=A0AAD8BQG3_BIOPF|nr:hypothetical protein Bpfe_011986 [Biomphalaria pfeifferi]
MVSQTKEGTDSVKKQLAIDSLVKKLHGQAAQTVVMEALEIGAPSVAVLWASLVGNSRCLINWRKRKPNQHNLFVCQTATSSSQEQPDQLEKEKAAPEENSGDGFVGNRLLLPVAPTDRPPPELSNCTVSFQC